MKNFIFFVLGSLCSCFFCSNYFSIRHADKVHFLERSMSERDDLLVKSFNLHEVVFSVSLKTKDFPPSEKKALMEGLQEMFLFALLRDEKRYQYIYDRNEDEILEYGFSPEKVSELALEIRKKLE